MEIRAQGHEIASFPPVKLLQAGYVDEPIQKFLAEKAVGEGNSNTKTADLLHEESNYMHFMRNVTKCT